MTKVLIAEDERPIARLLEMNLTRAGDVCTLAPDGLTAADLIEKNDYDLALLDIMLPGLDGYALLDYLRPPGCARDIFDRQGRREGPRAGPAAGCG